MVRVHYTASPPDPNTTPRVILHSLATGSEHNTTGILHSLATGSEHNVSRKDTFTTYAAECTKQQKAADAIAKHLFDAIPWAEVEPGVYAPNPTHGPENGYELFVTTVTTTGYCQLHHSTTGGVSTHGPGTSTTFSPKVYKHGVTNLSVKIVGEYPITIVSYGIPLIRGIKDRLLPLAMPFEIGIAEVFTSPAMAEGGCSAASPRMHPPSDVWVKMIHRTHTKPGYINMFTHARLSSTDGRYTVQDAIKAGMEVICSRRHRERDPCELVFVTTLTAGRVMSPARVLTRAELDGELVLWEGVPPPGYTAESALLAETADTASLLTQKSIQGGVLEITRAIAALGHRIAVHLAGGGSVKLPQPAGVGRLAPEPSCSICLDTPPTMTAMPCGHAAFCAECVAGLREASVSACPICRTTLTGFE